MLPMSSLPIPARRSFRRAIVPALPLLLTAALAAQKITALHVLGSRSYTPAQVVAASGLRLGEPFSPAVAQAAANRLVATGVFANVHFSYAEDAAGAAITLTLADQPRSAPVRFDNFVWFTPAQLQQALAAIPLFDGRLPENSGSLIQRVTDRLQQLLAAQQLPGTVVSSLRQLGPEDVYVFHVQNAKLAAVAYSFPGAPAGLLPLLEQAVADYGPQAGLGRGYSELAVAAFARGTLRELCRREGYLGARFSSPRARLLPGSTRALTVLLPLAAGPVYRLGGIQCAGSPVFRCAQLQAAVLRRSGLQPGAVADYGQLQQGILSLTPLYKNHGYFSVQIRTKPRLDAAAAIADIELKIQSGPLYAFGRLLVRGWEPAMAAKIAAAWKPAPGQPSNSKYLVQLAQKLGLNFRYELSADPLTRQVNIVIQPRRPAYGSTGLP